MSGRRAQQLQFNTHFISHNQSEIEVSWMDCKRYVNGFNLAPFRLLSFNFNKLNWSEAKTERIEWYYNSIIVHRNPLSRTVIIYTEWREWWMSNECNEMWMKQPVMNVMLIGRVKTNSEWLMNELWDWTECHPRPSSFQLIEIEVTEARQQRHKGARAVMNEWQWMS